MSTSSAPVPAKIDLTTFFLSIASAAYMGLGMNPRPGTAKSEENLELAKQNIDLLELMQTKTKGNLSTEESKLLDQLLFELRMRFVEKTKNTISKPL
jgi:hypothetical protein